MMPGASPTNAIAFSTERLSVPDMVRTGLTLNLICAAGILLAAFYLIPAVLGFSPHEVPAWAQPKTP
jgi:sodium-dependent dicarboxylate transporter 2/3/5